MKGGGLLGWKAWENCFPAKKFEVPGRTPRAGSRSHAVCWKAPDAGWLKLNTDGSFCRETGLAEGGGVIRDDQGKLILAFHRPVPARSSIIAEAWALTAGVKLIPAEATKDGINVPIVGAAAICCPWDSLQVDRFLRRKLVQRFYNKALTMGLKDYANWHKDTLSRLSNWEDVKMSRCVRDFDDAVTRSLANCETVDEYYRRCSSCNYVAKVKLPLLCISSLDDPICTSEAIPWDECRLNNNAVLATTQHGGHLPFIEGLTANSVWWVRAVDEFFSVLKSNPSHNRINDVK